MIKRLFTLTPLRRNLLIIGLVATVLLFLGAMYVVSNGIGGIVKQNPDVTALLNAKKDFVQGETAEIDTTDFTVIDSRRNYTPVGEQKTSCDGSEQTGLQFIYVKATYQRNDNPQLTKQSGYDGDVDKFRLNREKPCYTDIQTVSTESANVTYSIEYIFEIPSNTDELVLTNTISIYTSSVDGIFGSEGASTEEATYRITLK